MHDEALRADDIEELLAYLTDEEKAELIHLLEQDKKLFNPQPGPQIEALYSQADILGFGGAGGGGKSYLICGLALEYHQRTLILRREKNQTEKFVQDFTKIIGNDDGYNSQKAAWSYDGRLIEFGGLDDPSAHRKWQGRDHDLKAVDEATECREFQVRFILGWNRTDLLDQRVRSLLTFNPPMTSEGRWVIQFFGPWIDRKAPKRAKPGEILWFVSVGEEHDIVVPDHRPFVLERPDGTPYGEMVYDFDPADYKGARQTKIITPKSRSFIPSRVTDNHYYMATGYASTLQSLPEPLRSRMLEGDFEAGIEDDASQLIPTEWIEAAMRRWKPRDDCHKGVMDSMGVDVARGNMGGALGGTKAKDRTVISCRYGTWFDRLASLRMNVEDGPAVAAQVIKRRLDNAPVHIDIVGVGTSPYDFLNANSVHTIAINGQAKSFGYDDTGNLSFLNLRSEIYWRMREALDPRNRDPIALPDDAELLADLAAPRWWLTPSGIMVEPKRGKPKEDGTPTGLVARLGRSPDRGDAAVYALISTPKRLVRIGGLVVPGQVPEYDRNKELENDHARR